MSRRLIPQDFKVTMNGGGYRYLEAELGDGKTVALEPNGDNLDIACYRAGELAVPRMSVPWVYDPMLTGKSRAFQTMMRCLNILNGNR